MQKTLSKVNGCPQRDRSETEWYEGEQTFMWMSEDNIVEVPFDKEHLFEQILSPANLNRAYKAVNGNKGCGGIDRMSCKQLFSWGQWQDAPFRNPHRGRSFGATSH